MTGPWNTEAVQTILDGLRDGASVQSGGSRCHTTYAWKPDGFYAVHFEEGYESESPVSEDSIRATIAREPDLFAPLVRRPHLLAFREAHARGDRAGALAAILRAAAVVDPYQQLAVFAAALAWPEQTPDEALKAVIRDKLASFTAWHAFLDTVGWEKSPEKGRQGVAFIDALLGIVAEPYGYSIRASFHEMAEDDAAALADQQRVVDATVGTARHAEELKRLAKIAARLGPTRS